VYVPLLASNRAVARQVVEDEVVGDCAAYRVPLDLNDFDPKAFCIEADFDIAARA
jgi:hypothetical protein